ncbi:MAG TPA: membrane bound O-acyl transferase family-domain-containing protein [Pyrinomonadaceae bacterium]|nr:membrane bound O-acyl transferase family-domain-containing protein [Pyrinomonadaceae bacterium]
MGITITIVGGVLAALVTTGSLVQRIFGVSIAAALLVVPITMKQLPPMSYVTLTVAAIVALRVTDLSVERPSRSTVLRVLHAFLPFDTRLAKRCRPNFNGSQILEMVAWGVLSYVAFQAAANSPTSIVTEYYAIRWSFGLLWVVALFETISHSISVISLIFGAKIPPLHDAPYKARSLREFWSVRWNKLVGRWLREHCYAPLAGRGYGRLALTASFVASGAIHLYITSVLLDVRWGLIMGALFIIQVPLLFVEDALNIRQRSTIFGRIWTLGVLILLSPLFTEPVLRIFGLL